MTGQGANSRREDLQWDGAVQYPALRHLKRFYRSWRDLKRSSVRRCRFPLVVMKESNTEPPMDCDWLLCKTWGDHSEEIRHGNGTTTIFTFLRTAREGNVFRSVCLSTRGGLPPLKGGCLWKGFCPKGVCLWGVLPPGGSALKGAYTSPQYWHLVAATAAVGIHPTGMHSCSLLFSSISSTDETWRDPAQDRLIHFIHGVARL